MVERYGEETWFKLGDRDLATHILRTSRMGSGVTLTDVTAGLSGVLGVKSAVLPMSDDPVSTVLETPEGRLEFQEYFVRRGQRDEVLGIELRGIEDARPGASLRRSPVPTPSSCVLRTGRERRSGLGMMEALAFLRRPEGGRQPEPDRRRTGAQGSADRMLASLGHGRGELATMVVAEDEREASR